MGDKMLSNQCCGREDLSELQELIVRKVGKHRAKIYFDQLTRFLSFKIRKSRFDASFARVLGRENVELHNRYLRGIMANGCVAKVPPFNGFSKLRSKLDGKPATGYQGSSIKWRQGDALPPSPRRTRSSANGIRIQQSPLAGSLGRPHSPVCDEMVLKLREQQSASELHSLGSRPPVENAPEEDGKEVAQVAFILTTPLNVSIKLREAREVFSDTITPSNNQTQTCQDTGELPDTRSLMCHLEKMLEVDGMKISLDCANLLNNSMDIYLKRLIGLSIKLAQIRSGNNLQAQVNHQTMPIWNELVSHGRRAKLE